MKKHYFFILIFFIFCANLFAQNEPFKKSNISNRIEIEGDINFAWLYLSNLNNLQNLVPSTIQQSISNGYGKGSLVTLTLTNKGIIIEKVIKYDIEKRQISYKMLSSPLPIKDYVASFTLNKLTEKTFEIIFDASYKVQETNRQARLDAFNKLQLELLSNIKTKTTENQK